MSGEEHPSQNDVEIIVNTRRRSVDHGQITYDEVVALAFDPVPTGPYVVITVTYYRSQGDKAGDLLPGEKVAVHPGMVFDVVATDRS